MDDLLNKVKYAHISGFNVTEDLTYFMGIDLDNNGGAGPYYHDKGAKRLRLMWRHGFFRRELASDAWVLLGATIQSIDAEKAVLAASGPCGFHPTLGSSDLSATILENYSPYGFDISVANGKQTAMADLETGMIVNNLNIYTPIIDPSGNKVIPAAGDYILVASTPFQSGPPLQGKLDFSVVLAYVAE